MRKFRKSNCKEIEISEIENKESENNFYKEMYFKMFAKVSEAIDLLNESQLIIEEIFIKGKE